MNYRNPVLQDWLAAEYALGTLEGPARRRLERLLAENPRLQQRVVAWQERLMPLNDELVPVVPPDSVWRGIEGKVALPLVPSAVARPAAPRMWRALAAGLAVLSLALGLLLFERATEPGPPTYVSIVADAEGAPIWLLQLREEDRTLRAKALAALKPQAGKSFELWMLPADGSPPVSLGLLPATGIREVELAGEHFSALTVAGGLAVSVEPEGGSPTGQPTGPVVYTAALVRG
ncbi:MAG: anti-sigma factor [Gammaproteobacteria bacterium]